MRRDLCTTLDGGRTSIRPASYLTNSEWRSIAALLHLSDRQLQVVRCIFNNLDESSIGRELGVAAGTVHTHLDRLYRKLGVRCRSEVMVRIFLAYLAHRGRSRPPRRKGRRVSSSTVEGAVL